MDRHMTKDGTGALCHTTYKNYFIVSQATAFIPYRISVHIIDAPLQVHFPAHLKKQQKMCWVLAPL